MNEQGLSQPDREALVSDPRHLALSLRQAGPHDSGTQGLGTGTAAWPRYTWRMNDSERLALWQQWLDTITADVQDLLVKRHIFRRVGEIVMANPEIQQPGAFHEFLAGSYGAAAVMAVRRQVDDDSRAVSLLKLLFELRSRPDLVSRRRFVDLVRLRGTEAETAHHQFDEVAGKAAAHVPIRHVQRDIDVLKRNTTNLERFATLRVAHWDMKGPNTVPTFHDLHQAIDKLEKLVRAYRLIVLGDPGVIIPGFDGQWEVVFRHAWAPR